ncbi:AbrB/MazE/SpoVT family DNA-binding domain-containing protein [Bacillus sp. CRN 9]|uniref:AbrB/MazE/SpoVT family DNA-binding domain-containing protein n=1 Tax=Cytobacillus horneckiae TaxID=549687 RepID=UPI00156285F5|nr:AbrB/MazE/SpoVT family DNA-binding domain-containing protein [Bacillus sp. CRN 9]
MRSTGIVRKIDELGRITLPIEVRKVLDMQIKDPIEIFVDGEQLILKKYNNKFSCIINGEITHQNQSFCDGKIILSPEGAKLLCEELEEFIRVK